MDGYWTDEAALRFLATPTPYATAARQIFLEVIEPVLARFGIERSTEIGEPLLRYCGLNARTYRLFPGALYLLVRKALVENWRPDDEAVSIAASLELLHNATLIHDDMLDGHLVRGGSSTILAARGSGDCLLFGDMAIAWAFQMAAKGSTAGQGRRVEALAEALHHCSLGQLMDETRTWDGIEPSGWLDHWLSICHRKLAVGNGAVTLAAIDVGEAADTVPGLFSDFSIASQIINDFNDIVGDRGFHVIEHGMRSISDEAGKKPTLPAILFARSVSFSRGPAWHHYRLEHGAVPAAILEEASAMLEALRSEAFVRFDRLAAKRSPWMTLLRNYFEAPRFSTSRKDVATGRPNPS
jgi:geranylgeranyl pyrophosphate synthase